MISLVEFDHFCLEISLNPGSFNTISSLFPFYPWFILLSPFYLSGSFTLTDPVSIIFPEGLYISQYLLCNRPTQSSIV